MWVSSMLAREEDPRVIVVDPIQNTIFAYSDKGISRTVPKPKTLSISDFTPTNIDQSRDNFYLELADSTIIQLNRRFLFLRTILSPPSQKPPGLRLGSLYQWKIVGDDLIACGALLDEKDNVVLGFFRVPLSTGKQAPELLTQLDNSDYYLIGNSYITAIGTTAYYVAMSKSPAIFRVSPGRGPDRLASFPEDFRSRPEFQTKMNGPNSTAAHFAELETFSVASGLYSQDGFLYLLTRRHASDRTSWYIYKIDPQKDENLSPKGGLKLPTSSNHLSVAVGNDKWFLLERGTVGETQRQRIDKMLIIDSSAVLAQEKLPDSCSFPAATTGLATENGEGNSPEKKPSNIGLGCASLIGSLCVLVAMASILPLSRQKTKH
jgi:hypothetical protein